MKTQSDSPWEFFGQIATYLVVSDQSEIFSSVTFICLALVVLFTVHYVTNVVQKPEFICSPGPFRDLLTSRCPSFFEPYWPTFWCYNAFLMTIFSYNARGRLPANRYHREYVSTPDGGQLSLDWFDPDGTGSDQSSLHSNAPIAVFFPGLTGCSAADYLKSLVPLAHQVGYRKVVAVNYRGMGGTPLLTPRFYCGTTDDDIHEVIEYIRRANPKATKVVAVGCSLGGILLARYLIKRGHRAAVDAAMLISVCYNYNEVANGMETGYLNPSLNAYMTRNLINTVLEHRQWFEDDEQYDLEAICQAKTMREFDAQFIVKMFGYKNLEEYYTEAAHKGKMGTIARPTLAINAGDDMLSPRQFLPVEDVMKNSNLAMLIPAYGGHVGFMGNLGPVGGHQWYLERVVGQYLMAVKE